MIHIKETFPNEQTVVIQVDGRLNKETLEPLNRVISRHASDDKKIILSLQGLISVSEEGQNFFKRIKSQVIFTGLSQFLKLGLIDTL